MYPILILRAEFVCLVLLIFLLFTSKAYKLEKNSRSFSKLLLFAIAHVVFDIITVLTVNNTGVVPNYINWIAHAIFYITAI